MIVLFSIRSDKKYIHLPSELHAGAPELNRSDVIASIPPEFALYTLFCWNELSANSVKASHWLSGDQARSPKLSFNDCAMRFSCFVWMS